MRNAAMLWTGGKDSAMALFEAERNGCAVRCLVTFAPPKPTFLAHPLAFIELQAQALELPHHLLSVNESFERAYEVGLSRLRDEMGCDCVVTGDIAEVHGHPNWIRERSFNGYPPFDTCAYVVPFEDLDFGSAKALARRVLRSGSPRPAVPGGGRRRVRSPRC